MIVTHNLKGFVRDVPDWPKEGVVFKDLSPLLGNIGAFKEIIRYLTDRHRELEWAPYGKSKNVDLIGAVDARGFIFGSALSYATNTPLVMIRKAGKLPPLNLACLGYDSEYGKGIYEMEMTNRGERIHIIDDVLATGGSLRTIARNAVRAGYEIAGVTVVLDLEYLHEPQFKVEGHPVRSILIDGGKRA